MKKVIFILITSGILFSCKKNDEANSELIGVWNLTEIYADPGDGSGSFFDVDSDKTITFKRNGVLISNGDLCELSTSSDKRTKGTYSQTLSTFNSDDCTNNQDFPFELNGNTLIISYPCIEGCKAKYEKEIFTHSR